MCVILYVYLPLVFNNLYTTEALIIAARSCVILPHP